MVQVVQAHKATLGLLEAEFGLVVNPSPQFFTEWLSPELQLSDSEIQALARVVARRRWVSSGWHPPTD